MPKFTVFVHETLIHRLRVEASDDNAAAELGEALVAQHGELNPWQTDIEAQDTQPLPPDADVDFTEADFQEFPPDF